MRTVYKGYTIRENEDGTFFWWSGFTRHKSYSLDLAKREIDRFKVNSDTWKVLL